MKRLIVILCLLWPMIGSAEEKAETIEGEVLAIIDGDSLMVKTAKGILEVRLFGVDAPEYRQRWGEAARAVAFMLAHGKKVKLIIHSVDKFGRTLADVRFKDGRDLGRELVRHGLAWWYRFYNPDDKKLETLENQARSAKLGLWSDPRPKAPWDYRKRK